MAGSKHTPGPWAIDDYGAGQRIVVKGRKGFDGDYRVADAYFSSTLANCPRVAEMQANAKLIAAAPELLETLRAALPHLEENARWHRDAQSHAGRVTGAFDAVERAKAALAKATA